MPIAYVSLAGRGATDACLAAAVVRMQVRGLRLAGTVQTDRPHQGRDTCDMDLRVLPDGPVFRISQDLGKAARGCRLDGGALEQAVSEVACRMADAEVLIVNKFGKLEAAGHGFVPLIAAAMERDLPVVVGVNGLNRPALERFCGGLATRLDSEPDAILTWLERCRAVQDG